MRTVVFFFNHRDVSPCFTWANGQISATGGLLRTMLAPVAITETFSVTSALSRDDYAQAAKLGFGMVVSLLPDGEKPDALTSAQAMQTATEAGMAFAHVPTATYEVFADETVGALRRILAQTPGPVLAMCSSGQRAAIVWAAATARAAPVGHVLDKLAKAGFDLAFLRDDLEAQAHRETWQGAEGQPATTLVAA